jgi:ubiquinone/menaquinone biosynthesis C-methylase UbiE
MKPVSRWLSDQQLAQVYTAQYWNDLAAEKEKEWWIADGEYGRCMEYLRSSGLLREYAQAERFVREFARDRQTPIVVADLAAGIGWTSASLSKLDAVSEVRAVEISRHRLDALFEHAVKMMSGDGTKISRYLGSFYDLQFEDGSVDLVFLSQAFHHAENPFRLLAECDRVLRPKGRIILMGEHFASMKLILRTFASFLVRRRRFITNFYELFPTDPVFGDHYYRTSDYSFMFGAMGYAIRHERVGNSKCIYVADKK